MKIKKKLLTRAAESKNKLEKNIYEVGLPDGIDLSSRSGALWKYGDTLFHIRRLLLKRMCFKRLLRVSEHIDGSSKG